MKNEIFKNLFLPLVLVAVLYCLVNLSSLMHLGSVEVSSDARNRGVGGGFVREWADPRRITFTHVFSSYVTEDEEVEKEFELVYRSWRVAAEVAAKKGVIVEFVDIFVRGDESSVPSFASKNHALNDYFQLESSGSGAKIPYVGDILRSGVKAADGQFVVFTNSDIFIKDSFYLDVLKMLTKPLNPMDFYPQWLNHKFHCLTTPSNLAASNLKHICDLDTKTLYEDTGLSIVHEYTLAKSVYANRAINNLLAASKIKLNGLKRVKLCQQVSSPTQLQQMLQLFCKSSAVGPLTPLIDLQEYLLGGKVLSDDLTTFPEVQDIRSTQLRHIGAFGMTITRLEIPGALQHTDLKGVNQAAVNSGLIHPGNDCFVFARQSFPKDLYALKHPLGYKLWGFYVRTIVKQSNIPWIRVVSSRTNPLTAHQGVSGDNWRQRTLQSPLQMLQLQANFYDIESGFYFSTLTNFKGDKQHCQTAVHFRLKKYCNSQTPFCRGFTRLSCVDTMSRNARYMFFARDQCTKLKRIHAGAAYDLEAFCNSVLLI